MEMELTLTRPNLSQDDGTLVLQQEPLIGASHTISQQSPDDCDRAYGAYSSEDNNIDADDAGEMALNINDDGDNNMLID